MENYTLSTPRLEQQDLFGMHPAGTPTRKLKLPQDTALMALRASPGLSGSPNHREHPPENFPSRYG